MYNKINYKFKRMNEQCKKEGIKWSYEKTAYGFYFTFYRGTNVTLDVTLYPELSNEEKTIMIAIKNNNKITREELARLIKKIQEQFKEYSMV